ncbi:lipoyl(octanoyl) transferase LipB [Lacihabitans soyangensis]|uniref:Octanoyltransferase n=1 Tax=Lacihabitans soyangensis TaxID=869394 RepID=A0AAE3H1A7_9BACT|nr:lipoyl(octanoyl) transferase LipB [Lacihabitans soyangensis]MCP9763189.1 lipoyl(octanoyl) transferase LipB [Lacihabitans soyangensis]
MKNKKVEYINLGLIDYKKAWDFQEELFKKIVDIKVNNRNNQTEDITPNYLIFCQHPHVYTLGKSGKLENLLLDEKGLDEKEATFYKINRGGDITYHGPGQLVVYPILDLDNFFTDIHKYMRYLEEAVISICADYGINAGRIDGLTGVWINDENPRKLCAMGVKSSRWVTMHGLALNVNTDLNYFGNIVPCGIDDKAVSSIQKELNREIDMNEASEKLRRHLSELFEMELITQP